MKRFPYALLLALAIATPAIAGPPTADVWLTHTSVSPWVVPRDWVNDPSNYIDAYGQGYDGYPNPIIGHAGGGGGGGQWCRLTGFTFTIGDSHAFAIPSGSTAETQFQTGVTIVLLAQAGGPPSDPTGGSGAPASGGAPGTTCNGGGNGGNGGSGVGGGGGGGSGGPSGTGGNATNGAAGTGGMGGVGNGVGAGTGGNGGVNPTPNATNGSNYGAGGGGAGCNGCTTGLRSAGAIHIHYVSRGGQFLPVLGAD